MVFQMKSPASVQQRALQLQKRIYESLKKEAEILLGKTPASIREYDRENASDFRLKTSLQARSNSFTKKELIETVQKTDVTFIADFHTFDQAQRTALRIIREAVQEPQNCKWMIGLELVPSQFQDALDAYQTDKIELQEFHQAISYTEDWGFPWKNYEPIFDWAKENKVRLIGLNRPKILFPTPENKELHDRDQWAAGIMTDLILNERKKCNPIKMLILYGELHVGTKHLPHQLHKISQGLISWTTIHQNQDRLYWQLAKQNLERQTEVIQLKKNVFCVFSSTPWAKLQSLVNWVDGESSQAFSNAGETEPSIDYLSMIQTYGNWIAEFLTLPPPPYEALSIFSIQNTKWIATQMKSELFTKKEIFLIDFHIQNNQRLLIPRVNVAYLGSPSQNGAAELAAIHLLRSQNPSDILYQKGSEDFHRRVLEATFGFFGSLLIQPKRKCDLPQDHLWRIKKLSNREQRGFRFELAARKIAIGILKKNPYPGLDLKTITSKSQLAPASMMGARFLGQILATGMHQMLLTDQLNPSWIRKVFLTPPDSSPNFFEDRYQMLLQIPILKLIWTSPSKFDRF